MTADIRTAAQAEAGARVVAVTVVRQEIDSTRVIGQYYRVEPCLPTREQIARAIVGRSSTAGARAVIELLDGLAAGHSVQPPTSGA